jgi:hypothetical protein
MFSPIISRARRRQEEDQLVQADSRRLRVDHDVWAYARRHGASVGRWVLLVRESFLRTRGARRPRGLTQLLNEYGVRRLAVAVLLRLSPISTHAQSTIGAAQKQFKSLAQRIAFLEA